MFRISGVIGDPQEPLQLGGAPGFGQDPPTEVAEGPGPLPGQQGLFPNYPNPFNGATQIGFSLAAAEHARIAIYNLAGQRVRLVLDEQRPAGRSTVTWDGRDDAGRLAPSGVYIYAPHAQGGQRVRKLVLLR